MALAPTPPPARPEVPLALWPCAQPDPQEAATPAPGALLPAQLARRIVTEFSQPGALLVTPCCPVLLCEATRLGCRVVALTPDPSLAAAGGASALPAGRGRRPLAQVRSGSLTDAGALTDLAGQVQALVTVNLDGTPHPQAVTDPSGYAACAALLRPGGLLITVTRNLRDRRDPGRLVDHVARTIQAAEHAGFAYLQHVIALLAPIQAGQLQPRPTAWQRRTLRARLAGGERGQLPVHADVLVFAAPEAADA
jgi:hypothetical protein